MAKNLAITVTPGPLKVVGAETLHFCGEPVAIEADAYLCRCGGSASAPFCDGSHKTNGFKSDSAAREPMPLKIWQGKTLRTHFNPNACMHVFYCQPLAELRRREEAGDAAAASEIAKVVQSCPSGALTYEPKEEGWAPDGDAASDAEHPDIEIMEGGEIRIQRAFELNRELHEKQPRDRATLCRCGSSKNKPFCDGRHKAKKGFR